MEFKLYRAANSTIEFKLLDLVSSAAYRGITLVVSLLFRQSSGNDTTSQYLLYSTNFSFPLLSVIQWSWRLGFKFLASTHVLAHIKYGQNGIHTYELWLYTK